MRSAVLSLLLLIGSCAHAQESGAVLANARKWIDTLASPSLHGRGYVNGGDSLAAELIAAEFKRLGLKPLRESYFEPFAFPVNTFPDRVAVGIDGRTLRPGIDYLVDPASGSAQGRFDLVHLTLDDLLTPERRAMTMGVITGRAVALHLPVMRSPDSLSMLRDIERDLLHYGPLIQKANGKLTWGVAKEAHPFASIEIAAEVWNDTAASITLDVHNVLRNHHARNVWGLVKGKSSKKMLVITAHYDHLGRMGSETVFPGANDNASGVSMLLNLAAFFTKAPPRYDVLFIAFAGEEAGLVGSEWCAVDRAFDLSKVRLLVNLDLMGTGDEGITVVNAIERKKEYEALVALNTVTPRLAQVKERGPACNSDHCPFVKRGVPAIFLYTMGGITAYHDVFDKPETLPLTDYGDLYLTLVDFIQGLK